MKTLEIINNSTHMHNKLLCSWKVILDTPLISRQLVVKQDFFCVDKCWVTGRPHLFTNEKHAVWNKNKHADGSILWHTFADKENVNFCEYSVHVFIHTSAHSTVRIATGVYGIPI